MRINPTCTSGYLGGVVITVSLLRRWNFLRDLEYDVEEAPRAHTALVVRCDELHQAGLAGNSPGISCHGENQIENGRTNRISNTFLDGSIFEGILLTDVNRSQEVNFDCNDVVSEHLVYFDSVRHYRMGEEEDPLDSRIAVTPLSSQVIIAVVHCQFLQIIINIHCIDKKKRS